MKYIFESPVIIRDEDNDSTSNNEIVDAINYRLDHEETDLAEFLADDLEMFVWKITMQVRLGMGGIICRTTCETDCELKPGLLQKLTDYISGQFSDGWGECFEQVEFSTGSSDYYASFWNEDDWSINVTGFSAE